MLRGTFPISQSEFQRPDFLLFPLARSELLFELVLRESKFIFNQRKLTFWGR